MITFNAESFFALAGLQHAALFRRAAGLGGARRALDAYLAGWKRWEAASTLPSGVHLLDGPIFIAANCRIEPGAVLCGPMIVGEGCVIRTGAYLRGRVVLGRECIVGAHTEVKGAILLDGARAPHQAYVGDSILGRDVNLGAGTILSNVKNVGREVSFPMRNSCGGDSAPSDGWSLNRSQRCSWPWCGLTKLLFRGLPAYTCQAPPGQQSP
jgi:hypothetical protein